MCTKSESNIVAMRIAQCVVVSSNDGDASISFKQNKRKRTPSQRNGAGVTRRADGTK
jgi:hypothetical protein